MRKTVSIDSVCCDVCGEDAFSSSACVVCGKDYCWKCIESHAIQYHAYVFASGHGDATYCVSCDSKANDAKHSAYVQIEKLRREYRAFSKDFESRQKSAETAIKNLI